MPVLFLSGDAEICHQAADLVPSIETVATKAGGHGTATYNIPLAEVDMLLEEGVKKALSRKLSKGKIKLPETFEYVVNYKNLSEAYKMSYFPGMEKLDDATNRLASTNFYDIVTAHSFVVY